MKGTRILYIVGVFAFGIVIAFGLSWGFSHAEMLFSGKTLAGATKEAAGTEVKAAVAEGAPEEQSLAEASSTDPKTLPGKQIIADLGGMKIDLYQDGVLVHEFPIVSKGKPGTAWETIPGDYSVKTKEENHFSSIGHVWMPYSMQFFGNYFIHGWPYYEGGKEVPAGFSGGCIRLSTADAKEVYDFASIGTAVHVIGDQEPVKTSLSSYKISHPELLPKVSAQAYLIADLDTGDVIAQKNQNALLPTASLIKLLTAITSLDVNNQYQTATVSASAVATYGAQGELKVGERLPVSDLLYPLLLESSNDAAEVLAEHAGRSHFLDMMNEKAQAIGMLSTHADDPAGLSPETVSTAHDLMKLSQYVFKYKSFIADVTKLPEYTADGQTWHNISHFLGRKDFLFGKPGYTDEAHHTLVSAFSLPLSEFSNRNIVIILLDGGTTTKEADTLSIVDYLDKYVVYAPL